MLFETTRPLKTAQSHSNRFVSNLFLEVKRTCHSSTKEDEQRKIRIWFRALHAVSKRLDRFACNLADFWRPLFSRTAVLFRSFVNFRLLRLGLSVYPTTNINFIVYYGCNQQSIQLCTCRLKQRMVHKDNNLNIGIIFLFLVGIQ